MHIDPEMYDKAPDKFLEFLVDVLRDAARKAELANPEDEELPMELTQCSNDVLHQLANREELDRLLREMWKNGELIIFTPEMAEA